MKMSFLMGRAVAASLLLATAAGPVAAQRQGDQGVGVMLGNPSGFSYKIFLDERFGLDAALGVAQGEPDAHVTLLIHDFDILKRSPAFRDFNGDSALYVGFGPRSLFDDDDTEFGLRVVAGMSMFPSASPWEFFGELAPVLRLTPNSGTDFDFAVGLRYYFPAIRPRS